jgi:hypothetical protein
MKLPNSLRATVSRTKVLGYLLDDSHPRGKSKAAFFRRHGFDPADPRSLEHELMRLAQENEVLFCTETDVWRPIRDRWLGSLVGGSQGRNPDRLVRGSRQRNPSIRDSTPCPPEKVKCLRGPKISQRPEVTLT